MAARVGPMHGVCASAKTAPSARAASGVWAAAPPRAGSPNLPCRSQRAIQEPNAQDAHEVQAEDDHQQAARDAHRRQLEQRTEDVERQAEDGEDGREAQDEGQRVGQDAPSAGRGELDGRAGNRRNDPRRRRRGDDPHLAEVRGHDRQHARREEGDDAGEDRRRESQLHALRGAAQDAIEEAGYRSFAEGQGELVSCPVR